MKKLSFNKQSVFFTFFIILCVYKYSFYGFYYLPYLDDYIQYILYPSLDNPAKEILFDGAGAAYTRPLAAILDIYFWSIFSSDFSKAVIILSILYALSGIFFYKTLKLSGIEVSYLFFAFYAFIPTLTEGTFWISAATRIVPAMLFTSLSSFFMLKKKHIYFFISNLFSLCFYEQVSILSFFLTLLIFLHNRKKLFPEFLLSTLNVTVITAYYLFFSSRSDNAERLSFSFEIWKNLKNNLFMLTELSSSKQLPLYTKGFFRSLEMIVSQKAYIWLIILVILCILTSFFSEKHEKITFKARFKHFFLGFLLFRIPFIPFFVLENPWLNFRNLVPSVLGLAIMGDSLLANGSKYMKTIFFSASLYFIMCNVSEINDYTKTMIYDQNIIYQIAENPVRDSKNPDIYYYPQTGQAENYLLQNSPYNDHIMSITGSDWGLTGTVRTVTGNRNITVLRILNKN